MSACGARPVELSASSVFVFDQYTIAKASPPMPVMFGSVTLRAAAIAMAASAALPPRFRTSSPICDASGWLDATMPWVERTTDRPARNPEYQSLLGRPGAVVAAGGAFPGV